MRTSDESTRISGTAPSSWPVLAALCLAAGCYGGAELLPTDTQTTEGTATTGDPEPTGGDAPTGGGPVEECEDLRNETRSIFKASCSGCHSGPGAKIFDYIEDLDQLVASGKVKGGDPEGSLLYQLIDGDNMPQAGEKLSAAEKLTVHEWIATCTQGEVESPIDPPACVGKNPFISIEQMIVSMLDGVNDTQEVPVDDQKFIRYFTITHLYNAGYCDTQLDAYRHALAKLTNSLSNQPILKLPHAVDPERTIYRIDLRDYGWDEKGPQGDVWDLLVALNPYAVEYLQPEALSLQNVTGTPVPFQMGDAFVSQSAQAPLYDQILYERVFKISPDIFSPIDPMNRADLEAALGIDVLANIALELSQDVEQVARAGFQISGVSAQNRVIERHQFPDNFTRAYWLSYDFLENIDFSNIFYHPLDFIAAGGEIIWTLPNGLQGYLLVNDKGDRLDEANIDIVNNKEQNGAKIVNGVSCMGCHYKGMRAIDDQVRPWVDDSVGLFDASAKQQVNNIYPVKPDFAALLQQDSDVFVSRINATGAPLLIDGLEVANAVFLAFDQYVDMNRAAAELNLTVDQLLPEMGKLPDGLGMLKGGGFVNRDSMDAEYGVAICNLKLGITKACKAN